MASRFWRNGSSFPRTKFGQHGGRNRSVSSSNNWKTETIHRHLRLQGPITITSRTVNGDLLNVTSTITAAVETGNSVQLTTSSADGFYVGELVYITGVGNSTFDGTYPVASVIDATDFTYTNPTASLGSSSGGSAVNALGGVQRSMVDSIVYQFNQPATLGSRDHDGCECHLQRHGWHRAHDQLRHHRRRPYLDRHLQR